MKKLDTKTRRITRNRYALKRNNYGNLRLSVNRSGRHISAQIIDDIAGKTLVSCSSRDKDFSGKGWTIEGAAIVGKTLGEKAVKMKLKDIYFDRGGYIFHGRVKALAEGAREAGLKF